MDIPSLVQDVYVVITFTGFYHFFFYFIYFFFKVNYYFFHSFFKINFLIADRLGVNYIQM